MWDQYDITTRKKFLDNIGTTFMWVGVIVMIAGVILSMIFHSGIILAISVVLTAFFEIVFVVAELWQDWIATNFRIGGDKRGK